MAVFLLAHVLGDFVLQPACLVAKKQTNAWYLLLHCTIYTACVALACALYGTWKQILLMSVCTMALHVVLDLARIRLRLSVKWSFRAFVMDQALHIALLMVFACILKEKNSFGMQVFHMFAHALEACRLSIDPTGLAMIALCYLVILTPASVLIRHVLDRIHNRALHELSTPNIGSLIGKLERFVILTLGLMGLYASIAIVLTAKSLARFKDIEKSREFAETYLVGTLLSLSIALVCLAVLKAFHIPSN